jgi:hypothetical protein
MMHMLFTGLLVALTTASEPAGGLPENYAERFDTNVWMWSTSAPDVFQTRQQPMYLLSAAVQNVLDRVYPSQVIESLSQLQYSTGEFVGYYGDPVPADHNMTFFTLMPLIALDRDYDNLLSEESRVTIRTMYEKAYPWMTNRVNKTEWVYPNADIGNVVCTYLLSEILEEDPGLPEAKLAECLTVFDQSRWGWGEHLSDDYAKVCQDALSMLLLFSESLPTEIESLALNMLQQLEAIDLCYEGGMRVPAIRSYALTASNRTPASTNDSSRTYRELVGPIPEDASLFYRGYALREVFYNRQWSSLLNDVDPAGSAIACYGNTYARSLFFGDLRMGVMSKYPMMASTEAGLLWQSMPAAFWRTSGDWGFLQHEVKEGANLLALPANDRDSVSLTLTTTESPGPTPVTRGRTLSDGFAIVRTLPEILPGWEAVEDRLRVVSRTASLSQSSAEGWQRAQLTWSGQTLIADCLPLQEGGSVTSKVTSSKIDWGMRYSNPPDRLASIWIWQADQTNAPPDYYETGGVWTLCWPETGKHLSVHPYLDLWEIDEDFEALPTGGTFRDCTHYALSGNASIGTTTNAASGGSKSYVLRDDQDLAKAWYPYVDITQPIFKEGFITAAFDLMLDASAPAGCRYYMRDQRDSPYHYGPDLKFETNGDLYAGTTFVRNVPPGNWVHVEINCPIITDESVSKSYVLNTASEGLATTNVIGISQYFTQFGHSSFGGKDSVSGSFYLDNFQCEVRSRIYNGASGTICVEAENGRFNGEMDYSSWWNLFADTGASSGHYVEISPSAPDSTRTDARGFARYYFYCPQDGDYDFSARLNSPSGSADSFFWRVVGETSWNTAEGYITGADWKWKEFSGSRFSLGAGLHQLDVYYKDEGTRLDRFIISTNSAAVVTGSASMGPSETTWY